MNAVKKYFLPFLLLLCVVVFFLHPPANDIHSSAKRMQAKLIERENAFEQLTHDQQFINRIFSGNRNDSLMTHISALPFALFCYQSDSLLLWSTNKVIPATPIIQYNEGSNLAHLKNGWYDVVCHIDSVNDRTIIALILLKNGYPFENKFLKNEVLLGNRLTDEIDITEQHLPGAIAVKSMRSEYLFSIYADETHLKTDLNYALLFVKILLFLILLYYLHLLAFYVIKKQGFNQGFLVLIGGIVLIRFLLIYLDKYFEFSKMDLFNPQNYAADFYVKSLGDLVINCLLGGWLCFFYLIFKPKQQITNDKPRPLSLISTFLFIALSFVSTGVVTYLFKTLVLDSLISFEVYNILSLSLYSAVGMICIGLSLTAHYVISYQLVNKLKSRKVSFRLYLLIVLACAAIYAIPALISPLQETIVFTAIWNVGYLILLFWLIKGRTHIASTRMVFTSLAAYALFSTFLIENLYERKERNQRQFFAGKLVNDQDYVAEYSFEDVKGKIENDAFIRHFLNNPVNQLREISDRINSMYLGSYFTKYDLKLEVFDSDGDALRTKDSTGIIRLRKLIAQNSSDTIPDKLHFIKDSLRNNYYFALLPIRDGVQDVAGYIAMTLYAKNYNGQNVYPELLLGKNITSLMDNSAYNYAVYHNDRLVTQHGDFPYTYFWNKEFQFEDGKEASFIDVPKWEHLIQQFPNDKKVIVTIAEEGPFEPIATFSYLFTFYFIISVFCLTFYLYYSSGIPIGEWLSGVQLSFRNRINYSMLFIIILSFIIIGFVTINFFKKQYDNFYTDRLLRKEKTLLAGLEYYIKDYTNFDTEKADASSLENVLSYEVATQAEINAVDINVYDTEGNLAISSQPSIYDKGLAAKKMNPYALYYLSNNKKAQSTHSESIGGLNYLATYAPVRNNNGLTVAYLGIPYFEKSKNVNDEVNTFLVALMNVYVFLLICAALIAYFISNSITQPLRYISEKFRYLNLTKKNQPIRWKTKDEIGVLIEEYNKMIKELESSARKLAQNERESAWREMAKQIAHEIKNPLTPMKLSIQYLQRAIDEGNPNVTELAQRVNKTLMEQIENLSSIATAFSTFAQLPKPNNEAIELNELLHSVVDLFNKEVGASISYETNTDRAMVFADRNKLVSVFNNLIKNATQSIPEGREGKVSVKVLQQEDTIQVSVSDNGSGIEEEAYEKVFVPNFTTKSSGTGLGLAITKQIIDSANGKIWFETELDKGTTFFVTLPCHI